MFNYINFKLLVIDQLRIFRSHRDCGENRQKRQKFKFEMNAFSGNFSQCKENIVINLENKYVERYLRVRA